MENEESQPTGGFHYSLSALLLGVLALAMLLATAREFLFFALTPQGAASGVVLMALGSIVGSIFGSVPSARHIVIILTMATFLGILYGRIEGNREELWCFAVLNTGLTIGAMYRTLRGDSVEAVELPEVAEAE